MKSICGRCGRTLRGSDDARVCAYDCTFCAQCAAAMNARCPNCGGTLGPPTEAA